MSHSECKILAARYSLLELLGSGGMGSVYRARDTKLDRDVAIKRLKEAKRLGHEATAMAALTHPNIVKIHSIEIDDEGFPFLVLEYVSAKTLKTIVEENGALDADTCKQIALQTLDALQHAHSKGVIHRDLKPTNLMFDHAGNLKILDFGIAKLVGVEDQRLTKTGEIIGTPDYISPEQCGVGKVSASSDIYSLGCTLYFLLTGTPPFVAESTMEVLLKQLHEQPNFTAIADERLRTIVMKAMAKDPQHRFHDASEMARALASQKISLQLFNPVPSTLKSKFPRVPLPAVIVALLTAIGLCLPFLPRQSGSISPNLAAEITQAKTDPKFFLSRAYDHQDQWTHETRLIAEAIQPDVAKLVEDSDTLITYELTMAKLCLHEQDSTNEILHRTRLIALQNKYNKYSHAYVLEQARRLAVLGRIGESIAVLNDQLEVMKSPERRDPDAARVLIYDLAHFYNAAGMIKDREKLVAELNNGDVEKLDSGVLHAVRKSIDYDETSPSYLTAEYYLECPHSERYPALRAEALYICAAQAKLRNDLKSASGQLTESVRLAHQALSQKNISEEQRTMYQQVLEDAKQALASLNQAAKPRRT
jgi:serine/threonine protein kinase